MEELQALADEQRLDVSSDIAVELQKLLTYDGKGESGRSPRKARDAFAAERVERVCLKVSDYLGRYEKTFSDCSAVCRQIVAQLVVYGGEEKTDVDAVIYAAKTNEAFKPYYAQLVGAVGTFNLRAVFSVALSEAGLII